MNKIVIRIKNKNELEQLLNRLGGLKSDSGKYAVYVWDAEKGKMIDTPTPIRIDKESVDIISKKYDMALNYDNLEIEINNIIQDMFKIKKNGYTTEQALKILEIKELYKLKLTLNRMRGPETYEG